MGIASRSKMTPGLCAAPVLAHENPARVRGDPQHLRVLQPGQPCARCSENVDFWRKTPQPPEYAPIEIGVSLESDSHCAHAAASRSTPHSSFAIARAAIAQRAALPQGTDRSLSGCLDRRRVRRALVRVSAPDKIQPCSRPTCLPGIERRANQERHECLRLDTPLQSSVHILSAPACSWAHGPTVKLSGTIRNRGESRSFHTATSPRSSRVRFFAPSWRFDDDDVCGALRAQTYYGFAGPPAPSSSTHTSRKLRYFSPKSRP
jgi:hypothetical protein